MTKWEHFKAAIGVGSHEPPKTHGVLAFEGAGTGRRATAWASTNASPNTLIPQNANTLRARSRQMARNNAWAANALDTYAAEVVGTGIKPQSRHPKPEIRKAIQGAWLRWTDEADADGQLDFYGMQALAVRSEMEAGECFARLRYRRTQDALSVPLQVQLLEADFVPVEKTEPLSDRRVIRAGIEFDSLGRRAAYYVWPQHPGDSTWMLPTNGGQTVRVPASQMLHLYKVLRPGQLRGQPRFTPVLVKLHELFEYDDAEVVRKKTEALLSIFITKTSESDFPYPVEQTVTPLQELGEVMQAITPAEPGMMQGLPPGWKPEFLQPTGVSDQYEIFLKTQIRACAVAMGMTYDMLSGDYSDANFSSMRAALLNFRRKCEQYQHQILVFQFCRPTFDAWLETAILAGAVAGEGVTATQILREYNRDRRPFHAVEWRTPKWAWIDPVKDVQAEKMAVRNGFKSRSAVVNEQGYDVEQIDREIADDNARADDLGLVYDSDGRQSASASGTGKSERTDQRPPQDQDTGQEATTIQ